MQYVRLPNTATNSATNTATNSATDAAANHAAYSGADACSNPCADTRPGRLRGVKVEQLLGVHAAVRRRLDGTKPNDCAGTVRRHVCGE